MLQSSCNGMLEDAVNAVVMSFKTHSNQDDVNAVEALKEFWLLKKSEYSQMPLENDIKYKVESSGSSYFCFVTLPGGSSFGSFEVCDSSESAKQSAAKIALTNCVLNEHSCYEINLSTIKQILALASKSFYDDSFKCDSKPLQIFESILNNYVGKSFLVFQEKMSVLQLLHWNKSLKAMKNKQCSREEVLNHYLWRGIDSALTSQMTNDWVEREKNCKDIILKELNKVNCQISFARKSGHELRFHIEKRVILQNALHIAI